MIITLSGITGVGKSFFKEQISKELGIENLVIVTTREKREQEKEGIDKYFVTRKQFQDLKKKETIIADFEFLDQYYAYRKQDMYSNKNQVTELHYEAIDIIRKYCKNLFAIYIIPMDLVRAEEELKRRKLPKMIEEKRLKEVEKQISQFKNDEKIREKFDYIFENDYTQESKDKMIEIIKKKIERKI